jgi:hypothetical protein
MYPTKSAASVTITSVTVSSSSAPPILPAKTLSTPELESSPQLGSEWSYGSVRRIKRPPPVIVPGYPASSGVPSPSLRNFSITSASTEDDADDPHPEIPIYFGGLPEHLSARRPSTGIPTDADCDQYGFPSSSRSSSFGNIMDYSPLPKTPAYIQSPLSPLRQAQIERPPELVKVKGFHQPVDPFAVSAPLYQKSTQLVSNSPSLHLEGPGVSIPRSSKPKQDMTSVSLGSGLGRSIRAPASTSLSVPSGLAAYKPPREPKPSSRIRTDSQGSVFTISAYAEIPSETPPPCKVSQMENRLLDRGPPRSARLHIHPNEPISPCTVLPTSLSTPIKTTSSPIPSSPPSSTHAEAGFFLSQMDSYLAQHADTLRIGYPKDASHTLGREGSKARKPSLIVNTSDLDPGQTYHSAIERTTRSRGHLRTVSTASCAGGPGMTLGRIDANTTIQLSIDQVSGNDYDRLLPMLMSFFRTKTRSHRNRFELSRQCSNTPAREVPRRFREEMTAGRTQREPRGMSRRTRSPRLAVSSSEWRRKNFGRITIR